MSVELGEDAEEEIQQLFVRRADLDDVDHIMALHDETYPDAQTVGFENVYGRSVVHIVELIETACTAVTVEDRESHVVGFACFDDHPTQLSAAGPTNERGYNLSNHWEKWFREAYNEPNANGTNSVWMTFFVASSDITREVMQEILRATFASSRELENVFFFQPGACAESEVRDMLYPYQRLFTQLQVAHGATAPWVLPGTQVWACRRLTAITPLLIRVAQVEDHDNLVAVFDAQSEVVTHVYGEYFIAELIEAQNEDNKALVAEVDGRAVGLLCTTSDVDVNVLAQCFQLDPYDNLLKPSYMQRIREQEARRTAAAESGEPDSPFALGDYLQAALQQMDLDHFLDTVDRGASGEMTAVHVMIALQTFELPLEVRESINIMEFCEYFMALLWQVRYWEPMLEGEAEVEPDRIYETVNLLVSMDAKARKEIAQDFRDRWEFIQDAFAQIAEDQSEEGSDAEDMEGQEPAFEAAEPAAGDAGSAEDGEGGEDGENRDVDSPVKILPLLELLVEDERMGIDRTHAAALLVTLHWWGGEVDLRMPAATITEAQMAAALETVIASEDDVFLGSSSSPMWLANVPHHAKDVFCINMFCLDQAFQTQGADFLLPAFCMYPDKDYCVITQPHTSAQTPLLAAFSVVPPQAVSTFGHVLYLVHRCALSGPPIVKVCQEPDLEHLPWLARALDDESCDDLLSTAKEFVKAPDANREKPVFVFEFDRQICGLVMLESLNEDYVEMLRCGYHLDDYLLAQYHKSKDMDGVGVDGFIGRGHCKVLEFIINPLFMKFQRKMLQEAVRLAGRSVCYLEVDLQQSVPPIFRDMLQVAPRRPPALKKKQRQPPKVASFFKVEKVVDEEEVKREERQKMIAERSQSALSMITKKLLSEHKIQVNARVVVVGASDAGLSFLESLLSIPHVHFSSLTLLAPGGLEYRHSHHLPLVAGSAAYSHNELRRVMLELRVRVLNARMIDIDRQGKHVHIVASSEGEIQESLVPYDYLVIGAGLQDDALHALKIRSCGVEYVTKDFRRVNGAMSAADPKIKEELVEGGTFIKSLIWNPLSYAVVYGRSLNAYCVVQGLLMRKVPPTKVILVLPPQATDGHQLRVDAFEQADVVEDKIHDILGGMGVKVYDGYKLLEVLQDNRERLKALVLEESPDARGPSKPPEEKSSHGRRQTMGYLEAVESQDGVVRKQLACRILITADAHNVDPDVFNAVHGNGLVYDGRLIVDHNFQTTDTAIFGAGSLCEFSRRYRVGSSSYLRHDGFNGREVGAKLAHALLRILDPVNGDVAAAGGDSAALEERYLSTSQSRGLHVEPTMPSLTAESYAEMEPSDLADLLPGFYMPIARGGLLPGNLHFYHIKSARESRQHKVTPTGDEDVIVTDTLQPDGTGHFCQIMIDPMGKISSITYLGGEELQVESLWSLVGLGETFLNLLYKRWKSGDVPDIVEFLTDEWAVALFHDHFMEFCHQLKLEIAADGEVKDLVERHLENVDLTSGLPRKLRAEARNDLPPEIVTKMQDRLLEYLRKNTNHLTQYFLPENFSQSGHV